MTDTVDPESKPLEPKKSRWCFDFFGIASWAWNSAWGSGEATGTDQEEDQEEDQPLEDALDTEEEVEQEAPPSPAAQMLATLRAPRPDTLSPPESAENTDKVRVNKAYDELIELLEGEAPDMGEAASRKTALEQMVVKVAKDTAIARRKALYKRVGALQPPRSATTEELRDLAKSRDGILKKIKGAKTLEDLDDLDKTFDNELKTYADAVDLIEKLATERVKVEADHATFKKERKALAKEVDRGFYQMLIAEEKTVGDAIPGIKDPKNFAPLTKKLTDARGKINDAKAYAAHYDTWMRDSEIYILTAAPGSDRKELKTHRDALAKAAAAKATTADFAAAKVELAKFTTHAKVNATKATEVAAFGLSLKAVQEHPGLAKMAALGLPGKNRVDQAFSTARKKGTKDKNYVDGKTALDALKLDLDKIEQICDLWVDVKPLAVAAPTSDAGTKFGEAETKCGSGDWGAALTKINSVSGGDKREGAQRSRLRKLIKEAQPILSSGAATAHNRIKAVLDQAKNDLDNAKPDDADTKFDSAKDMIDKTLPWANLSTEALLVRLVSDPGDTYKLLKPAEQAAGTHDYPTAAQALKDAIASYAELDAYKSVKAQLETIKATLDDPSEELTIADGAIKDAEVEAQNAKIPDAVKTLRAAIVSLGEAAVEAGIWLKGLEPVEKKHKKVKALLELQVIKDLIDESLKETKEAVTVDKDYPKATGKLSTHADLLKDATEYAMVRPRVHRMKDGLDRAVAQLVATVPDIATKVYGGADDTALKQAMKVADDLAIAGKMRQARDEYRKLLTAWDGLLEEAAKAFETADGTGSNAGHSLDRHGSDITDEKLLRRLTTGIAADNKSSPTDKSSKFSSFDAWMEGRELSAQEAEKKVQPDGNNLSLAGDKIPANPAAIYSVPVEVEHPGPIDEAYVGLKPAASVDAKKGKLTEGRTFETYEKLSGITRSTALWLFEMDWGSIGGGVAKPSKRNEQTPAKFIELYKGQHGGTAPPHIPGKWVMMQLFPKVDGWDQEAQDYI